ncbi:MAG: endonuclease [Faecousia sp.]
MKSILRRATLLLLVLAMVLSMLPAVFAATGSKIYNNGTRDQACTALSSQAKAYYTGSYTYEKLSALSGATQTNSSYDATQNNPLYDALYTLMSTTQTESYSYNSLSTDFAYTDSVAGAEKGEMSDIWGGRLDTWGGTYFNREHVWPKSRASFYQINGGADRHHLRPASARINQQAHGNFPYGNTTNGTAYYDELGNPGGWSDGTYFEPNDNVKGDVARILLYVYVRWQQPNLYSDVTTDHLPALDSDDDANNGLQVIQSLDVLLQWCKDDPVDTWEMGRNDAAEKIQGNRNVFIDYPELAWLMFSQTIPKMTTPSGIANQQDDTKTYTVTWNVDGKVTTEIYAEGVMPSYKGSTAKADDADYSYTFTGWSPALAPVTANVTYTAQYSRTLHQYTVTWSVDGKKTTEVYEKYATPVFKGSTDKPSDGTYLYTFAGWSPAIAPVTANVTYTARYNQILITAETYTVTWIVDGKTTTEVYEKGAMPSYKGSTDKPSDGTYSYTFTGWAPVLAPVTADVTYTAQYSRTAIQSGSENYTITWYIDGRAVRETYAKGELPSFKGSTDKADDALYSYVFAGWTPRILPVTADATYTALYTKVPREADVYTVIWVVDGKQITEEYEEGETPVFQGSTDKADDAKYCYLFAGWSPALAEVTTDVTYTAQYTRYPLTEFSGFADVTEDDWFFDEVNRAAQLGLFNGVGAASFDPEGQVSRAMLVTVLYRLAGEPEVEFKTCFLDVKKGLWYSDAVIWAYEEGITLGTDAAHFSPDAAVTREQTATFLCRYAQWEGYDVSARADLSGFPDADTVSAYAEESVSWAVANGLISGSAQNGTDYLLPGGTAIRAQSAAIMVRFFNAFVK